MKKWIVVVILLVVIIFALLYNFIPSQIAINRLDKITANTNGLARKLAEKKCWKQWWPGTSLNDSVYTLNNNSYTITANATNAYFLTVKTKEESIKAKLLLFDLGNNATMLSWQYDTIQLSSGNIFNRATAYFNLNGLKKDLKQISYALSMYGRDTQKLYGIKITRQSIDQVLYISAKKTFSFYPHTNEINNVIADLRAYASANKVAEKGYPIYHVNILPDSSYELMAAISVSSVISGDATHLFKRMVPGGFLVATAIGDEKQIEYTNKQLQYFFDDNHNTSMAIDFCMMITDRQKEKDSTKWITDIYEPVY